MHEPLSNKHSVKHFVKHALHEVIHFDAKILTSLHDLVFKPGLLTKDYFSEQSSRYVKPLGLFIFINFLFFILKSHGIFQYNLSAFTTSNFFNEYINAKTQAGVDYEVFSAKFNTAMRLQQRSYFIFLVPLFALALKLVYWKRYYIEHLIFAFHTFAFFLLYLLFIPYIITLFILLMMALNVPLADTEVVAVSIIMPPFIWWLIKALHTYYQQKALWSLTKGILMAVIVLV